MAKYFTIDEFCHTDTGISNHLPLDLENNANFTVDSLDIVRELIGKPILINSGFRSEAVNSAVGGEKNSQHKFAQAADIRINGVTPEELFRFIKANKEKINYDQVIWEPNWVHISFAKRPRGNSLKKVTGGYIEA